MSEPIVSIVMITYGHENYIREAIYGVLMQDCDFDVELIIANDCSPDKTDEVIQSIIANHPNASWIKYIKHDKNLGMMRNFIFALKECRGDYIAICDGDDYWSDPLKLQKQVFFLENNQDFTIHSGNAVYFASENLQLNGTKLYSDTLDTVLSLKDFISKNLVISCTVMFRKKYLNFPEIFNEVPFGDWFTYVILLKNSGMKAYKSTEIYSVYRVLNNSIIRSLNGETSVAKHIHQILLIKQYVTKSLFLKTDLQILNDYFFQLFKLYISSKQLSKAFLLFIKNHREAKFSLPYKMYLVYYKYKIMKSK